MLVLYAHTDIVSRSSKMEIRMDLHVEFAQKTEKTYISNGWISMRWLLFCSKLRDSTWIIIFFKWCISFHRWLSPNGFLERTFRLPWYVRFWFARSTDVWSLRKFFKVESQKIAISIIISGCFATTKKTVGMIHNFYIPFICPQTALVISRKLMISLCWRNAVFDPQTIFIYPLEQTHIEKCSNVFNEWGDFSKYCIRHEISAKMIRTFHARAARASWFLHVPEGGWHFFRFYFLFLISRLELMLKFQDPCTFFETTQWARRNRRDKIFPIIGFGNLSGVMNVFTNVPFCLGLEWPHDLLSQRPHNLLSQFRNHPTTFKPKPFLSIH